MAIRVAPAPSVLLVNDTPEEREVYARLLRAAGYHALTAGNSVAAYRMAATHPPDVVVTDLRVAGSASGIGLTRRLRTNSRTSWVRVIVLTDLFRPEDADAALDAGADKLLEKPVPGPVLETEIARLLASSPRPRVEPPREPRIMDRVTCPRASGTDRTCPWCGALVIFRRRWPVLTTDRDRAENGRERIHYVAGWFCTNSGCEYRQLSSGSNETA
jgi:CheY-like chemotaxis protein